MTPADNRGGARAPIVTGKGAAEWLRLAAAPTFALMALVTAIPGIGGTGMLCSAGPLTPLGGMVPMYLLMSTFHAAPWLELIFGKRGAAGRSGRNRCADDDFPEAANDRSQLGT
jgi:hypothetical protein